MARRSFTIMILATFTILDLDPLIIGFEFVFIDLVGIPGAISMDMWRGCFCRSLQIEGRIATEDIDLVPLKSGSFSVWLVLDVVFPQDPNRDWPKIGNTKTVILSVIRAAIYRTPLAACMILDD